MKNYELAIMIKDIQDIIKVLQDDVAFYKERIYNLEEELKKIKKENNLV